MGTLFECLKEARLEKYYPAFRSNGITRSETLTQLTIHDCPAFGITAAEDKRRLVDLISIVKAVHNVSSERDRYSPGSASNRSSQSTRNKVPRKRNRSPAVAAAHQTSGRSVPAAVNDVRVRDRSHAGLSVAGAAFLGLMSDDSSEASSSESAEHSDYEPAVKHSVTADAARELPIRMRKTPVEKVKHGAGYNYGVPGSPQGARPKARASGTRITDDKIKVCVRKRPISKREVKLGEDDMVRADSTTTLVLAEPKQAVDLTAFTLQHEFIFDEVFDETCSNEDVYIRAARPLINCIFDGGSATCFAYGQTGAGKTHTMIGNENVPGLYLLAAHDIFSIISSRQYGAEIKVWVSFFEIYCGQLFDLLNKRNRLHVREDGSQRVCIAGLTETEANDEQNLMQVLEYGNAVRSKGSSGVNPDSSRSHAVLQMEIRDQEDKRLGRISFIDLAGSERASDSGEPDRQSRKEGAEINQSLLALKECIRSIDQESRHKPFRQSKLTHILKDSFMGNSRTCMIANISPGSGSCEHTLNTLRYADRVKELRKNSSSASTSKSMNVAMSNILMNIPASGPSLFQPSNILCSSTPMRQSTRQFTNRSTNNSELQLDPCETPIRGPGVRRKTSSTSARGNVPSQKPSSRSSASAPSRASVVRHVASNSNSNIAPVAASSSASRSTKPQNNVSSNSESDQTDTDSCNVTGQQKPINNNQIQNVGNKAVNSKPGNNVGRSNNAGQNIPVIKSTDTENDFPTTDFNDEEVKPNKNKQTNNDEAGLNDLNRMSGINPVTASVPVFPTGVHKQAEAQSRQQQEKVNWSQSTDQQFKVSSVSASVPVLRRKNYTDSQNDARNAEEEVEPARPEVKQTDVNSRAFEQISSQASSSRPETSKVSVDIRQDGRVTGAGIQSAQRGTTPIAQRAAMAGVPSLLIDSVDDDMLFDSPSVDQKLWTPRTPSESSGTQPKFPQNPSIQPEIPAVLPAKSTDLTTFSQRSPRWQLNKAPNQYTVPTQPQYNVPKQPQYTVPSQPQATGYRPEPMKNAFERDHNSPQDMPYTRQQSRTAEPAKYTPNNQSEQSKPKDNIVEYNGQQSTYRIPKQKDYSDTYGDVGAKNHTNYQGKAESTSKAPDTSNPRKDSEEPISATWFSTPADLDTHISKSVNRGRPNSSVSDHGDNHSLGKKNDKSAMNQFDNERTNVKQLDDEFLPLQRNKSVRNDSGMKSVRSDSDMMSALSDTSTGHGQNVSTNRVKKDPNSSAGSQGSYYSDSGVMPKHLSSQSALSRSRVVHSPVTDKHFSYNSSINSETTRQKVVHSPVNTRQEKCSSPIIRDYPSSSLASREPTDSYASSVSHASSDLHVNGKHSYSGLAIKTEKLQTGTTFSPIHPQPVTGSQTSLSSRAVSKDIIHPTPVGKSPGPSDGKRSADNYTDDQQIDLKTQLISSHEDQLATVTSLCKQEMKLLLGAKAGNKSFEDYMRRVNDVLTQKMGAIQLLQDQIIAYQLSTQDGNSPH